MKGWLSRVMVGLCVALLLAPVMPVQARTAGASMGPPVPLLWEVKGEGGSRVLLLGSFHLLAPQDYPLSSDVEKAYARADRLVFELSSDEMGSPLVARQIMEAAVRRDGSRLRTGVGEERWQRLVHWSNARDMPMASLQGLQAWFVALTVNLHSLAEAGMRSDLGLDRHLMARAAQDGKPVQGLETAQTQVALLQAMEESVQLQMLDEALQDAGQDNAQVRQLHVLWRRGDAQALWQQSGEPMRQRTPLLYQRLNADRNQAWLTQLPHWLRAGQGTTLVVVGALHLLGEDGLVQQLQVQGHNVQRLCSMAGCPTVGKRARRR